MSPSSLSISPGRPGQGDQRLTDEQAGPTRLITDTASLEAACKRLATGDFLALDTEFHREATYWPELCLVQAANEDFDILVDPLSKDLDLKPLLDLIADT